MSKVFGAVQIKLNIVDLIDQASDPSSGGGVAAAIGSFYLRSGTGQAWLKTNAADTNWTKLVQSFAWNSVKDFGARGDGATDDTASVQSAINTTATAGGGVVYFPLGTYVISQISLNAQSNVQLLGAGTASIIKWVFDAATVAGSLLTITNASNHIKILQLKFDGSGLTNPAASRSNHLIRIDGGAGGVAETQIMNCQFGGMVAASGDGVNIIGTAGNLVSRWWVAENTFDGCSRYSVGVRQSWELGWIVENYMTNCETEIGMISSVDTNGNACVIQGNELAHTNAVRHAIRIEGGATGLYTRVIMAANIIVGGFVTHNNTQYSVIDSNVITSGAFASADSVLRMFGVNAQCVVLGNLIDRDPAATAGACISLEKSTGTPIYVRVAQNLLINETTGGSFIKAVDVSACSFGSNLCRSTNGDASVAFAMDFQAVTANITNLLVGPGNQITAAAGSFKAAVRLLANGANVTDASIVGNQGNQIDYGAQFEIGGGGGVFNGQLMYAGNNFNGSVGDHNDVGVTIRPNIGFNAGTFGSQLFSGTGSPEGVITARISSVYLRTDGGQATAVYYKESGTGNTGWMGIGGGVIVFGTGSTTTVATAVFLAPGWIATAIATEIQEAVTRPGTVRNLFIQAATAGVTAGANVYTVRKNAVDTALTASIDNTATGATSDTTHSFTVVAGDLLSTKVVKAGVVGTGQANVTAAMELA